MGFDLSGMNPNTTRPAPPLPPLGKDWGDEEKKMYAEYREWQEENSGVYFRNSVWGWKPLWHFVTFACDDILTETDIERGSYNDGHKISKTKAGRIARRLYSLIKDGKVKEYESMYKKELDSLEQLDCDLCEATGKRQEPPKTGAGDMECNKCDGTGKVDDWAKSYPFSEENVRQFANFCANSGGFTIC
tara:strand:- start:147 stop:713 length:567 start_codon:yes stop_codon:yes gene_type:complete